jgi:hypothetical protein
MRAVYSRTDHELANIMLAAPAESAVSEEPTGVGAWQSIHDLLTAIEKEALADNAMWLTAHRQRKVTRHGR